MADDGTLAPDPRRLARAHRAGLRPTSAWTWPAAACLGLALALHVGGAGWVTAWAAGFDATSPTAAWGWMVGELAVVLAWTGGLAVMVAALTGSLGVIDRRAGEGLDVGARRSVGRGLLALVVPVFAVVWATGVCAGAARAVDASADGLAGLWIGWLRNLLFGTGGLLLVAGVVDRMLARRRLWRALYRTVAEARAERGAA